MRNYISVAPVLCVIAIVVGWLVPRTSAGQDYSTANSDTTSVAQRLAARDSWLAKDKADHLVMSAVAVAAQYYVLHGESEMAHQRSLRMAVASTFAIGLAKEIYDAASGRGVASHKDLIADLAGVVVAAVLLSR